MIRAIQVLLVAPLGVAVMMALGAGEGGPIPEGAPIASHTDLSCSNATWDAAKSAWRTTLTVAQTQVGEEGGFCTWGAIRKMPFAGKGAVYTISWEMMVPVGLNVMSETDAGIMKLMRINTKDGAGKNGGFIDIYEAHKRQDIPNARWGLMKEMDPAALTWIAAEEPKRGEFHSYEMRVVLDNVSRSKGGKASIQLRVNGVLQGESKRDSTTLGGPDHLAESVYFMTYYNGIAPEDQVRYFRNLEVEVRDGADSASAEPLRSEALANGAVSS
ncbi:MAG: hypothetical protein AB8G23_21950 [Myxococcota bacterium]